MSTVRCIGGQGRSRHFDREIGTANDDPKNDGRGLEDSRTARDDDGAVEM